MRTLVLINPNAARAVAALPRLRAWYGEHPDVRLIETARHQELREAIETLGPSMDRIVIGGGDGTLSAALRPLLRAGKPLAVLPLGTANDFARTLSIPDRPLVAAALSLAGREHQIDAGLVNKRPFLNVASVGVATSVSKAQTKARKRAWRGLSYVISFREALRKARPFYVRIDVDGAPFWKGMVHQVSVGNGRFHGGGLTVAENARIDDGLLNLYVVRPGTFLQLLACLATLKFGFTRELEALKRNSARTVRVRTTRPKSVNIDGDVKTKTPAEFSLMRHALTVIVPEQLPAGQRGLADE